MPTKRMAGRLETVVKRFRARYRRMRRCLFAPPMILEDIWPLTDELATTVDPVFVLSTGRCGTRWLTAVLSNSKRMFVNHALQPELVRQSRRAYELGRVNLDQLIEIVRAARDDLISAAHRTGHTYVETNNRITFFAPALAKAYPNSRFVHLYRDPADFVRSGIRRQWYMGDSRDIGRIVMEDREQWQQMSQLEQIAWLWNETNRFIEDFVATLESKRWIAVKAEEMFSQESEILRICQFVDAPNISLSHVHKMLDRPLNVQTTGEFPRFEDWSSEQRQQLQKWCVLAQKYGYALNR